MNLKEIEDYFTSNEWIFKFYTLTAGFDSNKAFRGFKNDEKLSEIREIVESNPRIGLLLINTLRRKLETYHEEPLVEDDPSATGLAYIIGCVYPGLLFFTDCSITYPMCCSLFHNFVYAAEIKPNYRSSNKC